MNTLLLDQTLWDFVLDASGNIAVASAPYAVAQDVASACRTVLGECYYNTTLGVPYLTVVLGQLPPLSYVKAQLQTAALTVPGCTNPVVYIGSFTNRVLTAQIQFTDSNTGSFQTASVSV